jgi:hypothetical protein
MSVHVTLRKRITLLVDNVLCGFFNDLCFSYVDGTQRPSGDKLVGTGAMKLIQSFLEDALSGEKRRLGFVFLYELLRGDLRLKLLPETPSSISGTPSTLPASPPPAIADDWACEVCTVINDGSSSTCMVCSTPHAVASTATGSVAPVMTWQCSACTTPNSPSSTSCVACGTGKEAWVCAACTMMNQGSDRVCGTCSTPRPPAPIDPSTIAVFGGAGGIGSSWLLGKLLCQMLYLQEEEGPKTDLKHPTYWSVLRRLTMHNARL